MWFYTLRFCFLRSVTSANPGNFVEPLHTGPGCLKAWLRYTRDNVIGFPKTYPLDSDLSGGELYPLFEQSAPSILLYPKSKTF